MFQQMYWWLLVFAFLLSGCGANLHLQHQERDTGKIEVWIDGNHHGDVTHGESLSLDVEPGLQEVILCRPDGSKSRLSVFVDTSTHLVLLPKENP